MPVIEQAKGILITQNGCDPDQAFDLLRRASQQANVPVRELAARLVEQSISRARATGPQTPSRL
jgi:AmiR/NasT family two-component response regulator